MMPIKKDDVAAYREQMKVINWHNEIDTKRVLEARVRKRAKAFQNLKAAQEKVDYCRQNQHPLHRINLHHEHAVNFRVHAEKSFLTVKT